jgi:hypothetical protein
MVAISFAAAAFALTSMVMAIPTAPSPSVTGTLGDAPSTLYISEEDARELVSNMCRAAKRKWIPLSVQGLR